MARGTRVDGVVATADVAVLGAGIIGAAIARELVVRGLRVALVDQAEPGTGSSGRCDGNVLVQTKHEPELVELTRASIEGYRRWVRDLGPEMHFEQPGSIVFFPTDEQHDAGLRRATWLEAQGVRVEAIDRAELRRREPALDGPAVGALDCLEDASVYPPYAVAALVRDFLRRGGVPLWHTRALELLSDGNGATSGVRLDRGLVGARWVVNAMGVWSPELDGVPPLPNPVTPRQGTLLVTEPVPGLFRRAVTESGYLSLRAGQSRDTHNSPVFVAEPTFPGNLLIGSSRRFVGDDTSVDVDLVDQIAARAVHYSSALARVRLIRSFSGLRPWTPDNRPIVGAVPGRPGYLLATGHEGEGIGLAPATADLVAALVVGGELTPLQRHCLAEFDPSRFADPGARVIA